MKAPTQKYLRAIYDLQSRAGVASPRSVAEMLGVTPQAAGRMLLRLAAEGLVTRPAPGQYALTRRGRVLARRLLSRRRTIEAFLTQVLNCPPERLQSEADALEQVASDWLLRRIARLVSQAQATEFCRPPAALSTALTGNERSARLSEIPPGQTVLIHEFTPDRLLQLYLSRLGLKVGDRVRVVQVLGSGRAIVLRHGRRTVVLGQQAARHIRVTEAGNAR